MRVQTALERLVQGRTTVIVAHRLSTIVKADCIVVLADPSAEVEGWVVRPVEGARRLADRLTDQPEEQT
ncbi:MAG: hypothetical protein HZB15_16645, partial [Actinobacteria bacterium]|nr:hypothetical protein [Actinomycetota bacterium]